MERGFLRLADELRDAAAAQPADHARALRAACAACVAFAVRERALLDLMFAAKSDGPAEPVRRGAEWLFSTLAGIMDLGVAAGAYDAAAVGRLTLLLSATVQGAATLRTAGRITAGQADDLVTDAVAVFLAGLPPRP